MITEDVGITQILIWQELIEVRMMDISISEELIEFINCKDNIKVLATIGRDGIPHAVVKENMFIENNSIVYLELLEGSKTNKNMIYSLWFNKEVAINICDNGGTSFQIKGIPIKTIVAGPVFEKYYNYIIQEDPQNDLAAIYYIEIKEITNETYAIRRKEHAERHPLYMHIDRLAK